MESALFGREGAFEFDESVFLWWDIFKSFERVDTSSTTVGRSMLLARLNDLLCFFVGVGLSISASARRDGLLLLP